MKFYRVSWQEPEPTAGDCEWFTNKRAAEKAERDNYDSRLTEFDVPTDRAGMLAFLNEHLWRARVADCR